MNVNTVIYMDISAEEKCAEDASTLLKSMANKRRLMILCYLSEGEKSVGELERMVGLSQSALSQHLARLRRESLVSTRRQAQNIFYSISSTEVEAVMELLYKLFLEEKTAIA